MFLSLGKPLTGLQNKYFSLQYKNKWLELTYTDTHWQNVSLIFSSLQIRVLSQTRVLKLIFNAYGK
jgi:hypothetical protein